MQKLYNWLTREDGQTMAEYAVVLAVITIAVFGALALLSGNIVNALTRVAGYNHVVALSKACGGAGTPSLWLSFRASRGLIKPPAAAGHRFAVCGITPQGDPQRSAIGRWLNPCGNSELHLERGVDET